MAALPILPPTRRPGRRAAPLCSSWAPAASGPGRPADAGHAAPALWVLPARRRPAGLGGDCHGARPAGLRRRGFAPFGPPAQAVGAPPRSARRVFSGVGPCGPGCLAKRPRWSRPAAGVPDPPSTLFYRRQFSKLGCVAQQAPKPDGCHCRRHSLTGSNFQRHRRRASGTHFRIIWMLIGC